MILNDNDNKKYILLSEIADKFISLADKLNCITNNGKIDNYKLINEIIKRARHQQLYLYCFEPVQPELPGYGEKLFFIWSYDFRFSSDDYYLMDCYLFLVNRKDRIKFDLSAVSQPRKLDVKTSGLYVSLDELAKLEREDPYFTELDTKVSNSGREEKKVKLAPTPEEPNTTKPTGMWKETSNTQTIPRLIDLQPVKCDSESISSSCPDLNADATVDQLSPASGSVQESHLIAQTKKQKKTKQLDKKKQKTTPCNADTVAEQNPLAKVAREASPLNTFADLQTRILSLEEIIGDREKKILPIIPVSRSTWYAGVNSGRFPKSVKTSDRRVAWRGSDIYALLQKLGLV